MKNEGLILRPVEEISRKILHSSSFIPLSFLLLHSPITRGPYREVAEWSNATVSKTVIPATVSGVRIPPSLQKAFSALEKAFFVALPTTAHE
jgi:hypothetical protein